MAAERSPDMAEARRFEITLLEELSSGTFARVYLAEARGAGGIARIVAVKVLHQKWSESDEILARTRDEAHLLARLRHKNIVRVEELTELNGQPAIIMEFVEGLDLKQLQTALKERNLPFSGKAALQATADASSALDAAFRRTPLGLGEPLRVVHRDIKPSNIMISVDGEVKVLDFGTARSTSAFRSAQTGAVRFGSWLYMSPERKEGERGDHSSDVYSLGLMTAELFSGEPLPMFPVDPQDHDRDVSAYIERIAHLGMPNESWDQGLREVLRQMTLGDPMARPTAQQVAEIARQYSEQASGPSLESLGNTVITEVTQKQRKSSEGTLTGTRLWISLSGSGSGDLKSAVAQAANAQALGTSGSHAGSGLVASHVQPLAEPAPRSAPQPETRGQPWQPTPQPAPSPAPVHPAQGQRASQPRPLQPGVVPAPSTPFDFSIAGNSPYAASMVQQLKSGPPPQSVAPVPPPASPAPPMAQRPVAPAPRPAMPAPAPRPAAPIRQPQPTPPSSPPPARPQPAAPRRPLTETRTVAMSPNQVIAPSQLDRVSVRAPEPQKAPAPKGLGLWLFLAFGVAAFLVVCFALVVLFVIPRFLGDRSDQPKPAGETPTQAETPTATEIPIHISGEGDLFQWVQVESVDKQVTLPRAQGKLDGKLTPGTYRLVAKVAARPMVSGELTVGDQPMELICSPADKGQVRCSGQGVTGTVLLLP